MVCERGRTGARADRFIPQRGSVEGDPLAFCQMESSYSKQTEREDSSQIIAALNLSAATVERRERREEHKQNVVASMINPRTIQRGYTGLGTANCLPIRTLKLTEA